ncbi:MAG: hypothetical protein U5L11_06800 [Arhodomonas sp.]|nr:hypothetical protein [Arhodomonas sp.]
MSYEVYVLLQVVHVLAGVFWAGASFVMAGFLNPTARHLGPKAAPFMQSLNARARLPVASSAAAVTTLITGIVLLAWVSGGFRPAWFTTAYGIILTTGSIAAFAAFLTGMLVQRPALSRAGRLSSALEGATEAEAEDLRRGIAAAQGRARRGGQVAAVLLAVSVVAMAGAR